jgi:hypothetical protein
MLEYPWIETVLIGKLPHGARHAWGPSAQICNGIISKCEPLALLILLYRWTLGFSETLMPYKYFAIVFFMFMLKLQILKL